MIVKFEEENLDVVWSIRKKQKDNNISNFFKSNIFYKIFIIFFWILKNYPVLRPFYDLQNLLKIF